MSDKPAFTFGVLFSQTGLMSVTEQAHLKGIILAVEEINSKGGVNGRLFEPIILDARSDEEEYARLTIDLLLKQNVNVIFGSCLSSCRKRVLPIIERFNGVLFYPSVYEGFEYSPNVIYGGATPNQMIIPLLDYLVKAERRKYYLLGSDTLFARETNRIVSEFLEESTGSVLGSAYVPLDTPVEGYKSVIRNALKFEPDVLLSTFVGNENKKFYDSCFEDELAGPALKIVSLTMTESELSAIQEEGRAGHLTAAAYFGTEEDTLNQEFLERYRAKFGEDQIPGVYAQTTYAQVKLLARAMEFTYSDSSEDILTALSGLELMAPGGKISLDPETNHTHLRCVIGESRKDGSFEIKWKSRDVIQPDPYLTGYDRILMAKRE
ncbi:transporter substrate-binding domain-containing protein [Sneathiella chinensis]|uniref:Amino acid ABC transporter substrate-binding protein n=1 Tax=Sneathiella chinensis TaxID=349750 RepID=A0ABQ5U3W9_9PROT|nr:transporter substrate-binding domain-containing protein [Sneathiella chinensis]GLQ06772.1 hypothetical protein GCM10007924_19930 [Sneathiella chinensis]